MRYSWKWHTNWRNAQGLLSDCGIWIGEHQLVIRFTLQTAVFLDMKILLILSTVKPEWRPLSSNCRPLPVTVLNGSSCHTGRNKKREASTQYFLNIRLRAFYTLSVGSLFTCYHAQKVLFVLEFMFAFTKLRLQISLPFEHGNVDTNYPRMHVVIFVCVCLIFLSHYTEPGSVRRR